ncbi:hypothetical protein C0Q70_17022 [Pomacea canaliculata]|uniref:Uncharacterized protein n=1 Tax=Pomacea canaliculata TaxID=400727 RepID=A0A2T7NRE5_POMCA|nr:hypothetical protein C0Q70_17022 [Pomacea canaliculata]
MICRQGTTFASKQIPQEVFNWQCTLCSGSTSIERVQGHDALNGHFRFHTSSEAAATSAELVSTPAFSVGSRTVVSALANRHEASCQGSRPCNGDASTRPLKRNRSTTCATHRRRPLPWQLQAPPSLTNAREKKDREGWLGGRLAAGERRRLKGCEREVMSRPPRRPQTGGLKHARVPVRQRRRRVHEVKWTRQQWHLAQRPATTTSHRGEGGGVEASQLRRTSG